MRNPRERIADEVMKMLLAVASEGSIPNLAEFLEREEINIHCFNESGRTPWMEAFASANEEAVITILSLPGNDLNLQDNNGMTPRLLLSSAAKKQNHCRVREIKKQAGIVINKCATGSSSQRKWIPS